MNEYKLTINEQKLIEKYQLTKDEDIAIYFFNKLGQNVLDLTYSRICNKFTSIPFEKEDLMSYVWNSLQKGLELYKSQKENLWSVWVNNSYFVSIREIQKYFKNTELILNHAESWENFEQNHSLLQSARSVVTYQKQSFKEIMEPIIDYVSKHNKTYTKTDIKKLMYLKSMGYSSREIAEKMHVSRRYVASMLKLVIRIAKRYLRASNW